MTITVQHVLTATTPDDPAYEIRPLRDWNNTHVVVLNLGGTDISNAFGNANNVTFGMSNGSITASASYSQPTFNQTIQTQNSVLLQGSSGSISFANSNGITFGGNNSVITASYNSAAGGAAISALGSSQNSGTVVFSNSNGVSFGMSGSTITAQVTASVSAGVAAIQLPNNTYTSGTVTWINSNGISFGSSGQNGVTASYTVPSTANLAGTVFSTAARTGSVLAGTMNSGGLTLGVPAWISTYSNAVGTGFSGTNASGTLNSAGLAISVGAGSAAGTAGVYGQGNTTNNSSGTYNLSSLPIGGYGIISVGNSNGSLQISAPAAAVLSQMSLGISGGNTSGNTGTVAQGQIVLAGGNNITLSGSTVGSNMTITVSAGSQAAAPVNFSAGTTSGNLGSVVFSNSNGVSFGLNGSTITASAVGGGGGGIFAGVSNLGNYAGSTGTVSTGNVVFAGYGGVSLSQSTGAAGSAATVSISAPSISNLVAGNTNISISTSGSTISIYGGTVAAAPVNISAGTSTAALSSVVFSNSNNFSFGLNGSTITGSYTVPNTAILAGTNLSTTTQAGSTLGATLNTSGLSLALPPWITTYSPAAGAALSAAGSSQGSATVVFSNSNNVSFGMNGGTITASASGGGGGIGLSAAGSSQSAGNIIFSNSNNISFGMNGSTVTGSIPTFAGTNFATTATAGSVAAATMNTSGMTLAMPAYLTTFSSVPAFSGGVSFLGNNAGTTGTVASQLVLVGSGIMSLSQSINGGSATVSILAPATSSISGTGIVSIQVNGSTISIGAPAQSAQPVAISGSNGSFAFSTVTFGNANGISFLSSNGSMVASGNFAGVGTSSGTSSAYGSTLNNVGLSVGAAYLTRHMLNSSLVFGSATTSNGLTASFNYMSVEAPVTASRMDQLVRWNVGTSANTSVYGGGYSVWGAIYSRNGSTLSSMSSGSTNTTITWASNTGNAAWFGSVGPLVRPLSLPINANIMPGEYFVGVLISTSANTNGQFSINPLVSTSSNINYYAELGVAPISTNNLLSGAGIHSVSTAVLPATIALSDIDARYVPYNPIVFRNA